MIGTEEFKTFFKNRKNLISVLLLGILILALPLGIRQLQMQQIIKSRAATDPVVFTGPNVKQKGNGVWVATKPKISLQITSPLGPPVGASTQTAQSKNPIMSFLSQGLVKTAYAAACPFGGEGDPVPCTGAADGSLLINGSNSKSCTTTQNGQSCTGHQYTQWCYNDEAGQAYCNYITGCSDLSCSQGATTPPSAQECSVSWTIPNSPAAGSSFKVSVKGEKDYNNQWDNVKWKLDGGGWNSITDPVTSGPTFTFTVPDAGAADSQHTLTFGSGNGARTCTPNGSFTTGGGGTPGSCPADGNLSVTPSSPKVGDPIIFQYSSANKEDQWVGGDTWSGGVGNCTQDVGGRKYTCTAQNAVSGGTWNHYWGDTAQKQHCGSATYTIGSGTSTGNGPTCTINGPKTAARGSQVTYSATSNDTRIRTMEIYYNFNDRGSGGDYHKIATCNTDVTGLSGGCKATLDTSPNAPSLEKPIPQEKEGFTILCNAYMWKPTEDGTSKGQPAANCVPGNNDPIHCRPADLADDAKAMANACTGNPLWSSQRTFNWNGCGNSSHQEVSLTAPTAPPSAPPSPVTTKKFRVAESLADLDDAGIVTSWKTYEVKTEQGPIDYTFKDQTPGVKTIFVQFMDSNNHISTTADCPKGCQAQIKLLGDSPKITSCSLSFEGSDAIATLRGENFGSDQGKVKSGEADLPIKEWKDKSIKLVWQNAPTGEALPVTLTNVDEQTGDGQCSAISQLSVGAKFFCGGPPPTTISDVDLVLAGAFAGGTLTKQTVSIDTKGVIQGLSQKLEEGKNYKLSLRAPRSLRKTVSFTAGKGTTYVSDFSLPLGDIFPADGGDGTINAMDKAELNRQWIIAGSASGRSADFNGDGRVNSIDWACMRHDYGASSDSEPVPGGTSAPSSSNPAATGSATRSNLNVGSTARP